MSTGKIFVLEDSDRWRNLVTRLLSEHGYSVDSCSDLEQARKILAANFYHLAILDIQLDWQDNENKDGMILLEELRKSGHLRSLKILMLSQLSEIKLYRDAFAKYGVLDFQSKSDFTNDHFVNKIDEFFVKEIKVNPKLDISWQSKSAEQAVINLRLFNNKVQIKNNSDIKQLIAEELDDLLRRLFHRTDSIIVSPLKPGMSGTGVLKIQAFSSNIGGTSPLIVKFGDAEVIKKEEENFSNYVRLFSGARHTSVLETAYTSRLGGIVYQLLGASDEYLENFSDFYEVSTTAEIANALDDLFYETCNSWYRSPGREQPVNISRHYLETLNISRETLEGRFTSLKVKRDGEKFIYFANLDERRKFLDPLSVFSEQDKTFPTYQCITHGDLNAANILVDQDKHTWLIDFGATGMGHILRDFVELDSTIRFQLLTAEDADLAERLALEDALLNIKNFTPAELLKVSLVTDNQKLEKAASAILHLYGLIGNLLPNKRGGMDEYHLTLLFYSLNILRFSNLDLVQRQHALLCAGSLFTRLSERGIYG